MEPTAPLFHPHGPPAFRWGHRRPVTSLWVGKWESGCLASHLITSLWCPLVASLCSKRGIVFQLYTAAQDLQAFCVKLPPAPNLRALGRVAVGAQRGPRCWLSSARTVESSALKSSIELGRGNWAVVGKPGNAVQSAERWAADGRGWRGDEGGRALEA